MDLGQVGLTWVKSSFSAGMAACVEFADAGSTIALRDSKVPNVHLHYTPQEIDAFIRGAKNGDFDHLLTRRT